VYYDFAFTVPKGTTAALPHEEVVNLVSGIVHRVEIAFPAGCRGTVYLAIYKGLHQVWPTNIDEAFSAEDYTIEIDEAERLPAGPNQFRLVGWTPIAQYDHKLRVRVGILPPEAIMPFAGIGTALKKFLKLVGVSK